MSEPLNLRKKAKKKSGEDGGGGGRGVIKKAPFNFVTFERRFESNKTVSYVDM